MTKRQVALASAATLVAAALWLLSGGVYTLSENGAVKMNRFTGRTWILTPYESGDAWCEVSETPPKLPQSPPTKPQGDPLDAIPPPQSRELTEDEKLLDWARKRAREGKPKTDAPDPFEGLQPPKTQDDSDEALLERNRARRRQLEAEKTEKPKNK